MKQIKLLSVRLSYRGGTCPEGNRFDDFASDIGSIPTGSSVITSTPTYENTYSYGSYSSTKEAKYDNNFLIAECTCSTSGNYCIWQPVYGTNRNFTYRDIIKIPCNEIYTKADFTFTCRRGWDSSTSYTTVASLSKTYNKINIGTYKDLLNIRNSNNQEEDLIIAIKKYDGYYTLSLGACTTGLYISPSLSLFPLSDTDDDKTIFRCVLYN